MTIGNALNFIKQGQDDPGLRHRLVKTSGQRELESVLAEENMRFSPEEFEEAYSLSLFKCEEHGDAEALMAFKMWWELLVKSNGLKSLAMEETE